MKATPTNFTVAEYCEQMQAKTILVNREYQRSPKVWPPAARSFLIDSLLLGFPIPKISLFQKTDLRTKKTVKEIVDGQQRSQTILDFFEDKFVLTGHTKFAGHKFSSLSDEEKQSLLEAQLSADVFVGATDATIREAFYRINSYNVPLNRQEQRHAKFQGSFKWFIFEIANRFSPQLKSLGTLTDAKLVRMKDAYFFAEISLALLKGIPDSSEKRIDDLYQENDAAFPEEPAVTKHIQIAMDLVLGMPEIRPTAFVRQHLLYSLLLALAHAQDPIPALNAIYHRQVPHPPDQQSTAALLRLADALENPDGYPDLKGFVAASSASTQRLQNRQLRFRSISEAIG